MYLPHMFLRNIFTCTYDPQLQCYQRDVDQCTYMILQPLDTAYVLNTKSTRFMGNIVLEAIELSPANQMPKEGRKTKSVPRVTTNSSCLLAGQRSTDREKSILERVSKTAANGDKESQPFSLSFASGSVFLSRKKGLEENFCRFLFFLPSFLPPLSEDSLGGKMKVDRERERERERAKLEIVSSLFVRSNVNV